MLFRFAYCEPFECGTTIWIELEDGSDAEFDFDNNNIFLFLNMAASNKTEFMKHTFWQRRISNEGTGKLKYFILAL